MNNVYDGYMGGLLNSYHPFGWKDELMRRDKWKVEYSNLSLFLVQSDLVKEGWMLLILLSPFYPSYNFCILYKTSRTNLSPSLLACWNHTLSILQTTARHQPCLHWPTLQRLILINAPVFWPLTAVSLTSLLCHRHLQPLSATTMEDLAVLSQLLLAEKKGRTFFLYSLFQACFLQPYSPFPASLLLCWKSR